MRKMYEGLFKLVGKCDDLRQKLFKVEIGKMSQIAIAPQEIAGIIRF